jgi:protein O-GlcNAc transferase
MTDTLRFADLYRDALALHRAGNLDEAERLYRVVLNAEANHGGALYGLGTVSLQRGRWEDAVRMLDLSLAVTPNQPSALNNRGVALEKLKRYDGALLSYERAIALKPDYAEAFNNQGNVLRDLGRPDEALLSYERAIALKPDSAEAFNNRGNSLYDLGRLDEALLSFERAIALKPHYVEAFNNQGNVLRHLRRLDEALLSYERAIALHPDYVEAFNNRGNSLYDLGRLDEALLSYERAIALQPDYADAFENRGNVLRDLGRPGDALPSYERALSLNPDAAYLESKILHTRMTICDWTDLDSGIERVLQGIERGAKASAPFAALALPTTPAQQRRCAEIYARNEFPPIALDSVPSPISSHERIRLGYFSAGFHEHPVSQLAAELFELHDRSRFEVFGFSYDSAPEDGMRQRLRRGFDRFLEVAGKSDRAIAAFARNIGIDIAIDLGGYTEHSRLGIFGYRPAPTKVHFLGYPGTLGTPFIDYLIADRTVIPEEHQRFYSENIAYLPDTYLVSDSGRQIASRVFARAELGLPPAGFVFCCFNNQYKINPAVFDIWMRLLQQVEGSVLWLSAGNANGAANLRNEANARGVAAERIVFAQRIDSSTEHLARLRAADLFLDTFSYNAHTTASDALWAGLPVLTCLGGAFAGRVAASLLNAIGLPEMIANSHEEYAALALSLATHPDKLGAIRQKLSDHRMTYPLFDTPRFARNIEAAYARMRERHQQGLAPEHIYV